MKYIMLEITLGDTVQRAPIMFPNFLVHAIVAESLLANPLLAGAKVVSAGEFSSMDLRDVTMHGKSTSLNISSSPEDDIMLHMLDYTHGL